MVNPVKILLVSATQNEILPFLIQNGIEIGSIGLHHLNNNIDVLISGIGMVETAISLSNTLSLNKYNIIIQAGIAGSLSESIKVGEVVLVTKETLIELGAENDEEWMNLAEMQLHGTDQVKANAKEFTEAVQHLTSADGISVNRVHGNAESIRKLKNHTNAQIESMEGFAFLRCAEIFNLPCIQIRSISNRVEKRNKDSWNIPLAIVNLNIELHKIISFIHGKNI